ncbi:MAG TPA: SRPBCC domain-containing protein [Prolixibacteraceae bacterium]|nr:SRPBCC domain-containing protein [Prolixibacteraceae bacterium]
MREIKRYYRLNASPLDVYNALTQPLMIEIWTGEPVVMPSEEGSEFSMWGGAINGRLVELVPGERIVQIWYFDEIESTVCFKLHPDKKGTSVELRQNNIPDEAFDNISEGWDNDFFGSLQELFNE